MLMGQRPLAGGGIGELLDHVSAAAAMSQMTYGDAANVSRAGATSAACCAFCRAGCWEVRSAGEDQGEPTWVSRPRSQRTPRRSGHSLVEIPQADLDDLRARIVATRWPEKEPVEDRRRACSSRRCRSSRATGRSEYDWHKCEETGRPTALHHPRSMRIGLHWHFGSPGRAGLPEPHLLQRSRPRWPLRRLGAAGPVLRRAPRGLPLAEDLSAN